MNAPLREIRLQLPRQRNVWLAGYQPARSLVRCGPDLTKKAAREGMGMGMTYDRNWLSLAVSLKRRNPAKRQFSCPSVRPLDGASLNQLPFRSSVRTFSFPIISMTNGAIREAQSRSRISRRRRMTTDSK